MSQLYPDETLMGLRRYDRMKKIEPKFAPARAKHIEFYKRLLTFQRNPDTLYAGAAIGLKGAFKKMNWRELMGLYNKKLKNLGEMGMFTTRMTLAEVKNYLSPALQLRRLERSGRIHINNKKFVAAVKKRAYYTENKYALYFGRTIGLVQGEKMSWYEVNEVWKAGKGLERFTNDQLMSLLYHNTKKQRTLARKKRAAKMHVQLVNLIGNSVRSAIKKCPWYLPYMRLLSRPYSTGDWRNASIKEMKAHMALKNAAKKVLKNNYLWPHHTNEQIAADAVRLTHQGHLTPRNISRLAPAIYKEYVKETKNGLSRTKAYVKRHEHDSHNGWKEFAEKWTAEAFEKSFKKSFRIFTKAWNSKYNPLTWVRKLEDIVANAASPVLQKIGIPKNVADAMAGAASSLLEVPLDVSPLGPLIWTADGFDTAGNLAGAADD